MFAETSPPLPETHVPRRADLLYWRRRNRHYHEWLERHIASIVEPGRRVLDLRCQAGDLLNRVAPLHGVGVSNDERLTAIARRRFPHLTLLTGDPESIHLDGTFDYVLLPDLLGEVSDVWALLRRLRDYSHGETRLILSFYNFVWEPLLKAAEALGLKRPQPNLNWLGRDDVTNLLQLCSYEVERFDVGLLCPKPIPLIEPLANDVLLRLPPLRHLALVHCYVARPAPPPQVESLSCSVIVPCRNEVGNIADAVDRLPTMGTHTELVFVDGASTDGTREAILDQIARHPDRDISLIDQQDTPAHSTVGPDGKVTMLPSGKGDAVRKGFAAATGDVLMILDADLTVPPEDLPRFYLALAERKGQFINGSRLVYPMEDQAMRLLNLFGNKFFSLMFTWLLGQRIKDTLCGTKVLRKTDYERIAAARKEFGDFDPFGDFDLLFGAARLGMRIAEMPVRYRARVSGHTKVRPIQHGLLLLKMCLVGFKQLKWRRRRESRSAVRARPSD